MGDWPNRLRNLSDADPSLVADGMVPRYQASSDKFVGAPQPLASSLVEVFGHSYAMGEVGPPDDRDAYASKLARMLGAARLDNRGWGGAVGCWPQSSSQPGGYAWVLQQLARGTQAGQSTTGGAGPYAPQSHVVVDHYGILDLAALGSTHPLPFEEAARVRWSRYCAAAVFEDTDASWAYGGSGTWSTVNSTTVCSGAGYHSNATAGATATWTSPADFPGGRVVAFGFVVPPGTFGGSTPLNLHLAIDGGSPISYTIDASSAVDSDNGQTGEVVLRVGQPTARPGSAALASGSHTFAWTLVSTTGATPMNIDYAAIEADPAAGPVIVCPSLNRIPSYTASGLFSSFKHGPTAATDPMNDASVAAFTTALKVPVPEFSNVIEVDVDTPLGDSPNVIGSDSVHPNRLGHALIADALTAAAQNALTPQRCSHPALTVPAWFTPVASAGASLSPGYTSGNWQDAASPNGPVGFRRDLGGRVYLRGCATVAAGTNTSAMFTLPAGYRPAIQRIFPVNSMTSGFAQIYDSVMIQPSGVVTPQVGGSASAVWLDGISFMADQ